MFKTAAFAGAICLSMWQLTSLKKQWLYYDRFYPEPTELQKTLYREAQLYKELDYQESSVEDKMAAMEDPELRQKYKQMYMIKPQRYLEEEKANDINAAEYQEHW